MENPSFCSTSLNERQSMLESIGLNSIDDLYEGVPKELRSRPLRIPDGTSEMEMLERIASLAGANRSDLKYFCGAGYYDHFIPSSVDTLASRGEFLTAYTPYQPEAAQGSLQAIFEYQTAIVRLTGLEVSNASLYDGGTSIFEGIMLAVNQTRRSKVVVDVGVSPIYRKMLHGYVANLEIDLVEIDLAEGVADRDAMQSAIDTETACVVLQNPNFFGCIDDLTDIVEHAHSCKALALISAYPQSLALLKTPGEMGADIATGEGQSLGIPLSFGGPYLGYMAVTKKLARKMPGRVVGITEDTQGRKGFVLTLQTREQHIRRQKATSNICTNQANCALRAVIYISLLGKQGMIDVAQACAANATYAIEKLTAIDGVNLAFEQSVFNEFALELPVSAADVTGKLLDSGFAAGFPVGCYYPGMDNIVLIACTEKRTRPEIDALADGLGKILETEKGQ